MDKVPTKIPSKYADFTKIFSPKLAVNLLKYMGINDHIIKLINDCQPLYDFIYNIGLVKLEILKTYIENNLDNGFIRLFKFLVQIAIFFDKKPNGSLQLYIYYQGFNNLTMKNQYPLSLVRELIDQLG